ncbi:MAG: hypothetical protein TH68_09860 [Candidatus Synechococcus spongiarum 142]|uniref:Bacteriophage T5 Orf172 DNA-binding domain-containing protein n=1 Tax=Candidatus Synechococcus spongiarum 142 TaxID=1608213 RepID=A0A6N3X232_9SYNE|nr:MAG: hypothetical protein TH68_09860 [Candidatus Synechococcus spongiarum 142]
MDLNGILLSPQLIKDHLQELMKPGKPYKREELIDLVKERHLQAGGILAQASIISQFKKGLQMMKNNGDIENPLPRYWRIPPNELIEEPAEHEDEPVKEPAEPKVELTVGDGAEKVYGWYYPAYRKLSISEGKNRFPIKVGCTTRNAEQRVQESCGTAPEQPVLGFVAHVDESAIWERFIHSSLTLDGWKRYNSNGNEWFDTSLEELHKIVSLKLAEIERAKKARIADSPPSDNDG